MRSRNRGGGLDVLRPVRPVVVAQLGRSKRIRVPPGLDPGAASEHVGLVEHGVCLERRTHDRCLFGPIS